MRLTTFPFSTQNVNGEPITVNSLRHLRKLEREHGVQFHAYNVDEKNFGDPPRHDPALQDIRRHYKPIYGDRLEDLRRQR